METALVRTARTLLALIIIGGHPMAAAAACIGGHLVHPDLEIGAAGDLAMQQKIFGPLGMTATTFDVAKASARDGAEPHGEGITGQPMPLGGPGMALNRSIRPPRPAGGPGPVPTT